MRLGAVSVLSSRAFNDLRQLRCTVDPGVGHSAEVLLFSYAYTGHKGLGMRGDHPLGFSGYNQHNLESHAGLPHRQTPFVPHLLRYAPSKALEKP